MSAASASSVAPRRLLEARPQHQVLGRIAHDDELREHDEIRARARRAGAGFQDQLGVAVEIADGRIDLCERD